MFNHHSAVRTTCNVAPEYFEYGIYIPPPVYDVPSPVSNKSTVASLPPPSAPVKLEPVKLPPPSPTDPVALMFSSLTGGKIDAKLPVDKVGLAAQKLGFAPSQRDLMSLQLRYSGGMSLDELRQWIYNDMKQYKASDTPEALAYPFRYYDSEGVDVLTFDQMCNILSNFGERLDRNEVENALGALGFKSGDKVEYKVFIKKLLASNANTSNKC